MLQDCMQIDEAMRMFHKAMELQPNVASTYVYLGYKLWLPWILLLVYDVLLGYCMSWLRKISTLP